VADGKIMAVLCWLGFFVVYGLLAIVIRVVERDGNRFARWHAAEAVNLQLTLLMVGLVAWVPALVLVISAADTSGGPPAAFFVLWGLMMAAGLTGVVLIVLGAVRAGQGAWWRCPLAVPFLRRHRREGVPSPPAQPA